MKAAQIKVSERLLVELLNFPENTEIVDIDYDFDSKCFRFVVKHEDLKDIPPDEPIPFITPEYTKIKFNWNQ